MMRSCLLLLLFLAPLLRAAPAFITSPAASVLVVGGSMMKGNHFADATLPAMRKHYAGCRRIVLVLHANHPRERDRMERRLQEAFEHLGGMTAESLHRHDKEGAMALLREADGIFIGGGQTFALLRTLDETGQLDLIRERVLAGVPLGGSSAGANVAGLVIGTTNDFPVTDVRSREALAVFPAVINPHHPKAGSPDFAGRAGKIRTYLDFNPGDQVLALGDAAIARLDAGVVTIELGPAWLYRADGDRALVEGEPVDELAPQAVGTVPAGPPNE